MNMSYCRFENTLSDLRDCLENVDEEVSRDEHRARKQMIIAMAEFVQDASAYYEDFDFEDYANELPHKE